MANVTFTLCLAATLAWRLTAWRRGEAFLGPFRRTSPVHGPIGAFVLLSILACFFSTWPLQSLVGLKGFGTFLLVPFTMAFLEDEGDVKLLLDVWRLTAAYLVVRGFLEILQGRGGLSSRLTGGLSAYMTYAGLLMIFSLLLGSRGLSGAGSPVSRGADLLVAAASAVALTLTLTRNAYLGLGVGLVTLALVARPRLAFAVPALFVLFFFVLPRPVRERAWSTFDPADETARDRLVMWKAGLRMIADRPFFGVGPRRVARLYPVYRQPGFVEPRPGHLHNNSVMIAAETGLLSLLAYWAFNLAFFAGALPRARRPPPAARAVVQGAVAAMAALFAAGMFEYNFGDVEVLMATLVLAVLPFAGARKAAEETSAAG